MNTGGVGLGLARFVCWGLCVALVAPPARSAEVYGGGAGGGLYQGTAESPAAGGLQLELKLGAEFESGTAVYAALLGQASYPSTDGLNMQITQGSLALGVETRSADGWLGLFGGLTQVGVKALGVDANSDAEFDLGSGAILGLDLGLVVAGPLGIGVTLCHSFLSPSALAAEAGMPSSFAANSAALQLSLIWGGASHPEETPSSAPNSGPEQRGDAEGDDSESNAAAVAVGAVVVGAALACALTKSCRNALGASGGGTAPVNTAPSGCSPGVNQGCCSYHGGIAYCTGGTVWCSDGTESPTCRN